MFGIKNLTRRIKDLENEIDRLTSCYGCGCVIDRTAVKDVDTICGTHNVSTHHYCRKCYPNYNLVTINRSVKKYYKNGKQECYENGELIK